MGNQHPTPNTSYPIKEEGLGVIEETGQALSGSLSPHPLIQFHIVTLADPGHPISHTTNQRLTQLFAHLSKSDDVPAGSVDVKALQSIRALIQKYDSGWPMQDGRIACSVSKERVFVTGTTGALGSHLLAQLLKSDMVEKVWAVNRKSTKGNTRERQIASFEDKLLDAGLLNSEKLNFIDADLLDPKLGISTEVYDEIRSEATIIIHNAWGVNLKLGLESLEHNIRGARHLLDLAFSSIALSGLPRFAFASTISVAGLARPGRYLNETSVALEDAATSSGYGQSKVLLESAKRAGLPTCILRIGQLTGDFNSGSWSTTDWVPSLIASSISVGCLPGGVGAVSWLPLDVAAGSIIDVCLARDTELPLVAHVSHPRPVPWMAILSGFSASISSRMGVQLPIVTFSEWNKHVVKAAESFKGHKGDRYKIFPTIKIQKLIDGMAQSDNELQLHGDASNSEFNGLVRLSTTVAETLSETLRSTPELGEKHVERWFGYWESVKFFKSV